jgi:hypothetical protein
MKLLVTIPLLLAGCLGADPDAPAESEVESESVPLLPQGSKGQGSTMQGSTMQGSTMQGSTMQGSTMQGSTMQASYSGMTASFGSVQGTALVFWTRPKKSKTWEQRFPDKICYWNSTRTVMSSCVKHAVGAPIVGSTWPTTFVRKNPDGSTTNIAVTLRLEAVRYDTTMAMHPLNGSSYATGTRVAPYPAITPTTVSTNGCDNPDRCRINSDIFNYDLKAIDVVDANGQNPWLCPAGQTAIALAGTWNAEGTYVASSTQLTFACTNGVIAKCTRWGYRHYDQAIKDNTSGPAVSLAPYHQACVRAAMADYCGTNRSMTRDGTMIDIYDYTASFQTGFIPKTRGFVYPSESTSAFAWEAVYSTRGAERIDSLRYAELALNPDWSVWTACPGTFWDSSSGENFANFIRHGETPSPGVDVYVDSVPACAHSEYTVGKWLHRDCTYCTGKMPAHCNDPADPRGWDGECVAYVTSNDDYPWQVCSSADNGTGYGAKVMSLHSECATGAALGKFDTGCTIAVCSANPSCCNPSSTWSQTCVDAANTTCRGGREDGLRGFCGYFPGAGGGGGGVFL